MLIKLLKTGLFVILTLGIVFIPMMALADEPGTPGSYKSGFTNPLGSRTIPQILQSLVTFLLGLIALLALAGIIYGGLKVITSFGDSGKVESGKHIVFWSIVGLVIAVGAVVIVEVVTNILGI